MNAPATVLPNALPTGSAGIGAANPAAGATAGDGEAGAFDALVAA